MIVSKNTQSNIVKISTLSPTSEPPHLQGIPVNTSISRSTEENHDRQLFLTFREYGAKALQYRQKCIGLLPEIFRRRIHEQQGYPSIFEFAAKFAGISQEQVKRVLSLDEKFQDKPALKLALESGEVSVNKLIRVASIATVDNEQILAESARILSKSALEILVRETREQKTCSDQQMTDNPQNFKLISPVAAINDRTETDNQLTLTTEKQMAKSELVPGHKIEIAETNYHIAGTQENVEKLQEILTEKLLKLSPELCTRLRELKGKGLDINMIITELLDRREADIARQKDQIASQSQTAGGNATVSRYIPVQVRRILQSEHGNLCSIPGCHKRAESIHHTQRFAIANTHNPYFLAPLCAGHHELAHAVDLRVMRTRQSVVNTKRKSPVRCKIAAGR